MAAVQLKRRTKTTCLELAAEVNVSQARSLHSALKKALDRNLPITLSASKVSRIDTAGIQVLLGFCTAARARGLDINWQSPSTTLISVAMTLAVDELMSLQS